MSARQFLLLVDENVKNRIFDLLENLQKVLTSIIVSDDLDGLGFDTNTPFYVLPFSAPVTQEHITEARSVLMGAGHLLLNSGTVAHVCLVYVVFVGSDTDLSKSVAAIRTANELIAQEATVLQGEVRVYTACLSRTQDMALDLLVFSSHEMEYPATMVYTFENHFLNTRLS
ncbi:MAG: hypothetical protein ABIH21_02095 [Patescibacteria group bacterium]